MSNISVPYDGEYVEAQQWSKVGDIPIMYVVHSPDFRVTSSTSVLFPAETTCWIANQFTYLATDESVSFPILATSNVQVLYIKYDRVTKETSLVRYDKVQPTGDYATYSLFEIFRVPTVEGTNINITTEVIQWNVIKAPIITEDGGTITGVLDLKQPLQFTGTSTSKMLERYNALKELIGVLTMTGVTNYLTTTEADGTITGGFRHDVAGLYDYWKKALYSWVGRPYESISSPEVELAFGQTVSVPTFATKTPYELGYKQLVVILEAGTQLQTTITSRTSNDFYANKIVVSGTAITNESLNYSYRIQRNGALFKFVNGSIYTGAGVGVARQAVKQLIFLR